MIQPRNLPHAYVQKKHLRRKNIRRALLDQFNGPFIPASCFPYCPTHNRASEGPQRGARRPKCPFLLVAPLATGTLPLNMVVPFSHWGSYPQADLSPAKLKTFLWYSLKWSQLQQSSLSLPRKPFAHSTRGIVLGCSLQT